MIAATAPSLMTTEELFALPEDDDLDRELFRGELREEPMTKRSFGHSKAVSNIGKALGVWCDRLPAPRGAVVGGEAACRIRRNPDTTIGVDVAYISPEVAAATPKNARFVDAPPVLAVEVLSPSDRHQRVVERIEEYLACGVQVVWLVDPILETVEVFHPDAPPVLFNAEQTMAEDRALPGLRAAVRELLG